MAHAYFVTGETEQGIELALSYSENELGLPRQANPNVMVLRHGLLSVDDARRLRSLADLSPTAGDSKVLVIAASRLFHEAQNALLKLFEEPPSHTHLILVVPAEGMLLPTLRSRLSSLPTQLAPAENVFSKETQEFLAAKKADREKILTKLLDRTKSDKEEEKQSARLAAIQLIEGLTRHAYSLWREEKGASKRTHLQLFLDDLQHFQPILHERSAPIKLIFEHILLTAP